MWILIVILLLAGCLVDWGIQTLFGIDGALSALFTLLVMLSFPATFVIYHLFTRRGRAAADRAYRELEQKKQLKREYDRQWLKLHGKEADRMSDRDADIYLTLLECEKRDTGGKSSETVYIHPDGHVYTPPADYSGPLP